MEEAEGRLLAGWLRQREEEEAAAELQKEMKRVIRTVVKDPVAAMPRTEGGGGAGSQSKCTSAGVSSL